MLAFIVSNVAKHVVQIPETRRAPGDLCHLWEMHCCTPFFEDSTAMCMP
jgi:hypothetical protein